MQVTLLLVFSMRVKLFFFAAFELHCCFFAAREQDCLADGDGDSSCNTLSPSPHFEQVTHVKTVTFDILLFEQVTLVKTVFYAQCFQLSGEIPMVGCLAGSPPAFHSFLSW